MAGPDVSSGERILLVEGRDDLSVMCNLCRSDSGMPKFQITAKGGWDELRRAIRGEIIAEGRAAVGIVVDANDSLDGRWQGIAERLQAAGLTSPPRPARTGTIIETSGKPRVGIWVMPDNLSTGELENFVARMIPSTDPVWPLSEEYIDGIPEKHRKFAERKIVRAKVHAWLAARNRPRLMGTAIRAGDLDMNGAQVQMFLEWLRDLFGSPAPEST